MGAFQGRGITLSSSRLSYPHPYRITYFREGPTVKIDEEGWVPILLDTITDTNGSPYIFFVLHRELLEKLKTHRNLVEIRIK